MATRQPNVPDFSDSDMMNYVVRMVTPLRREFSRTLDVPHFMSDPAYAQEILSQASLSVDERLRGYARVLESRLLGPRYSGFAETVEASLMPASGPGTSRAANAPAPSAVAVPRLLASASAKPGRPVAVSDAAAPEGLTEQELRAQMLKKYRSGLR